MPKDHSYFVYILASKSRRLYIGMTNDLEARVWDHRNRQVPGHTSLYNIDRLIYFEEYSDVDQAIDREKQLKKWRREKKIDLAESLNPTWRDLAVDWYVDHPVPRKC